MSAVPCIDPREVLFSFPRSSVGMRRGRSASGLAPTLERGATRNISRKDAKTQRRKINRLKTTLAMRPWRSFFASLRLCVRLFFFSFARGSRGMQCGHSSRSRAEAGECRFSFPRSSVGMRCGRSASGLAPLERGARRKVSRKGAKTQRRKINRLKTTRAMRPWRSFFASLRLCVRLFFSRSHAPAWKCRAGAPRPVSAMDAERPRLLPRWSVGARGIPSGRGSLPGRFATPERRDLLPRRSVGAESNLSQRHGDTEIFSFFSVSPCLRERIFFSSRSHAEALLECPAGALLVPALQRGSAVRALCVRYWHWTQSARTCSHAGAWEPERDRSAVGRVSAA